MANSPSGESMIERVTRVLDTFSADRTVQTASEIGRQAGLPSATAHRVVDELVEETEFVGRECVCDDGVILRAKEVDYFFGLRRRKGLGWAHGFCLLVAGGSARRERGISLGRRDAPNLSLAGCLRQVLLVYRGQTTYLACLIAMEDSL